MPVHIVDVAEFYAPLGGGVKTYIDAKFAYAHRVGARLTVLAPGPENRDEPRPGGLVRYLRSPAIPFDRRYHLFARLRPLYDQLDALAPDIVEASSFMLGALAVATWRGPTARRARRALVLHADFVAQHPQTWFRKLLPPAIVDAACFWYWAYLGGLARAFDTVVAGTRWMAERVRRQAGIEAVVVPWGVDLDLFHPSRRDLALRAELLRSLGLPEDGILLLGVGRHHHEKRWPMLFEAVARAGRAAPVAMVQVGDGFRRGRIEAAARAAGNVRLLGRVADRRAMARLMASADALVHASRAETFGLVASEALASGLPLVLPDAGGCTDVADPAWAETYRSGSSRAAARAILRLVARDPCQLRAAAVRGRATRILSTHEHFERLFALYDRIPPSGADPLPLPSATPLPAAA
ncbi:MAG: glycosyltransferase [Thermaurantiacus sp.]|uniref:glycosyltransferase n=1 Tax=Thermaurantiacus sp. TaxID=2820283 RepID=UPI00298EE949|nr:glycosyltransferase [Thermaurantiacus sp.]MDW8415700.1 glycosyltransferase [Thermaurantiacus sp.]